jgi:tetratricopeptide (TPR) repeat protein
LLVLLLSGSCLLAVGADMEARGQSSCAGPEALEAAARAHPTAASYTELGIWFGNHRQFPCATQEFQAALKLDPRSSPALDGISRSLIAEGDSASVVALLERARLNEALTVDLGQALMKQGRFDDAAETLSRGLTKYPGSQDLTEALGGLYILEDDGDRAVQVAEKTARARPVDLRVQRFYLRTLVTKNDAAKAIPLARRLLATAPDDADLLYLSGVIESWVSDYPAARAHLEKSVAIDPANADCHYRLGFVLARIPDYARAKEELEKAIALGEPNPAAHYELAMVLRNLGQAEQAKAQLKLFEEGREAPEKRKLAAKKSAAADHALAAGDASGAAALYREAFDAQPQEAMLAYKWALALNEAGDMNAERTALLRAVEIDPGFALAQEQLGYVESQLGNISAAEERFREALRAAPEYAQGWVSLATALAIQSRFAEARQAVATALKLEPKNASAIELSKNLAASTSPARP